MTKRPEPPHTESCREVPKGNFQTLRDTIRARQDKEDFEEIGRVYDKSRCRYGARKVFAIGLERMATRWLTTSFGETSTTLRAAPWNG